MIISHEKAFLNMCYLIERKLLLFCRLLVLLWILWKNHGSVSLWMVNLMNMVSQTIIHCCNLLVLEGAHIYGSLCRGSAFVSLCTQFVLQLKILDLIIVIVCFYLSSSSWFYCVRFQTWVWEAYNRGDSTKVWFTSVDFWYWRIVSVEDNPGKLAI